MQGRYIFTLLAFLANMMNLLGRDSLRLAILPMKTELNLTESEVSHVLGGYNYGMVLTMLTGGPLSDILGGKWLLVVVTLLSGLCTALVPPLASLSLTWLVVSQVVYGLAGGQTEDIYQHFSVSTDRDGGHLHLKTELDYEAGRLYQVVVEARDRASLGQANRARATLIVEVSERRSDTWRGLRTVCRWWTLLTRPRSGSPCRPSPGYRRTSRSSLRWVATALAPAPVNFITSMYV